MIRDVIDLREWNCAKCGAALELVDYEGDSAILRCEACAEYLGPGVIRMTGRTKTRS